MNDSLVPIHLLRRRTALLCGWIMLCMGSKSFGQNDQSEWLFYHCNVEEAKEFVEKKLPRKAAPEFLDELMHLEEVVKYPSPNPWFDERLTSWARPRQISYGSARKIEMVLIFIPDSGQQELDMGVRLFTTVTTTTERQTGKARREEPSDLGEEERRIAKITYLTGVKGDFLVQFHIVHGKKKKTRRETHTFLIGFGHSVSIVENLIHKG